MALHRRWLLRPFVFAVVLGSTGCSDTESFTAVDRKAGERVPMTQPCDPIDPMRCQLPWPSSRFLTVDDSTLTGVRQVVDPMVADDNAASVEMADGFSRVSPLLVGTVGLLSDDVATNGDAIRAWVVEPGHPDEGQEVPLRVVVQRDEGSGESLLVAYPRRPMPANVAVLAAAFEGGGLMASDLTRVAMGLSEPADQEQADLRAYHAPARRFLSDAQIELGSVARVWDFVTRSDQAVVDPLLAMREATRAAVTQGLTFTFDAIEMAPKPGVAAIAEGVVTMPYFVTGALPDATQADSHDARFRVVLPAGTGDYPMVLFGHGLGGSYDDPAFDEALAAEGLGKLGVDFHGWTVDTFLDTMGGFIRPFAGSARAVGLMMQSVAELSAFQLALSEQLADQLAGAMLAGEANPAVGRRPDMSTPLYGGGSLGGTVGYLYANVEPSVAYAAVNVGGAGWTHYLPSSRFFAPLDAILRIELGSSLDVTLVVAQAQTNLDYIDGAVWADHRDTPAVFLIQESVGDVVLPNIGTELIARTSAAVRVGRSLTSYEDLDEVDVAVEATAVTQYRVTGDEAAVHGFAITDTVAGEAARAQIRHFFGSALAGEAEVIVPSQCTASRCDFADSR